MKTNNTIQNSIVHVALVTAGILMIPLIAMQFSSELDWDQTDFFIMGAFIFGTSILIELVRKTVRNNTHRIAIIIMIMVAFLSIWAELAVGIFTNLGS